MRETVSASAAAANHSTAPDTTTDADANLAPATAATSTAASGTLVAAARSAASSPAAAVAPATAPAAAAATVQTSQPTMKRPLTLDLNNSKSAAAALFGGAGGGLAAKRQRFNSSVNAAPVSVLNSPDLQMLKLASPELEKFMTNSTMQTPTPSLVYPQKVSDCVLKLMRNVFCSTLATAEIV